MHRDITRQIFNESVIRLSCFPLVRVQTIQQKRLKDAEHGPKRGAFQILMELVEKQKISLWKGAEASMIIAVIKGSGLPNIIGSFLNSFLPINIQSILSTIVEPFLVYPFDLARVKLSDAETLETNSLQVLSRVFHKSGLFGLYRGLPISILSKLIFKTLFFTLHSTLASIYPSRSHSEIYLRITFTSAFVHLATYPLMTIMRRMQVESAEEDKKTTHGGYIQSVKHIIKEGGIKAFYDGYQLHICNTVLSSLLLLGTDYLYNSLFKK